MKSDNYDFYLVLTVILIWTVFFTMCSCKSVKYVPVESVRTEIEYRDRVYRDSVRVFDSVHVRERSDTVIVERWHTLYKEVNKTDTLYVSRTDTIRLPYPVERELSRWERFKMDAGGVATGMIVALCFIVVWLIRSRGGR